MSVTTIPPKKRNNNRRRSLPTPSAILSEVKGKKIDIEKIERAHGVLRSKRLKPLKIQQTLRDQWE
ncbi:MAG: hypothetical protein QME52_04855 [Bacteroidota bacterium]|nr:hypothetical protein [Bacteroidota bacterium]